MTIRRRRTNDGAVAAFAMPTPTTEHIERERLMAMVDAHLDAWQANAHDLNVAIAPRLAGLSKDQAQALLAGEYVPALKAALEAQFELLREQIAAAPQ